MRLFGGHFLVSPRVDVSDIAPEAKKRLDKGQKEGDVISRRNKPRGGRMGTTTWKKSWRMIDLTPARLSFFS